MKFLLLLALVLLAWRYLAGRWPWQKRLPARGDTQAVLLARGLLGVPADADRQDILDAHRRTIATVHPDRGGSSEQVHAANAARDVLLGELSRNLQEPS